MSLSANKARLNGLTKELMESWEITRESWRDSRSAEFENKYLKELRADVSSAIASLEEAERLLVKIHRDCE